MVHGHQSALLIEACIGIGDQSDAIRNPEGITVPNLGVECHPQTPCPEERAVLHSLI